MIVAVPDATPVTTPVVLPTVATPVDELDHVPPVAADALDKVRVEPTHTVPVLVINEAGGTHENTRPESGLMVLLYVHVEVVAVPAVVAVQSLVVVRLMKFVEAGPLRPT